MKRILFLLLLGVAVCQMKLFAGTVTLSQSAVLNPTTTTGFSTSDFTVCGSGQRTFKVVYSFSSHSSCWSDRYRFTFELFHNGNLVATEGPDEVSNTGPHTFIFGFGIGGITVTPGTWTVNATLERRPCVGAWYWAETITSNAINVTNFCAPPPCPSGVTISGTFTTPLTEASSSIKSAGTTIIPGGAVVKLDANDNTNNGFIDLNPGFETQGNTVFIAEALDGCGGGSPAKPAPTGIEETLPADVWRAFPNPTTGIITVQHPAGVQALYVYGIDGKLYQTFNANTKGETKLDIATLSPGMYMIRANGQNPIKITKQ